VDLRRGLHVLRRWWLVLVVGTLLGAGAAYVVSKAQPSVYEATALLQENAGLPTAGGVDDPQAVQTSLLRAVSDAVLIHTMPVAQAAISATRLGASVDPAALLKNSSVVATPQSPLITIRVRWGDPNIASRLATALAKAFVVQKGNAISVPLTRVLALLRKQLARYGGDLAAAQRSSNATSAQIIITSDRQQINSLLVIYDTAQLNALGATKSVAVAQEAVAPGDSVSPRTTVNVAVAAVLVLLVLIAVAVLSEVLSTKPRDPAEAAAALGLELLGTIGPAGVGAVTPVLAAPSSSAADGYRLLRVALGLGGDMSEGGVVVVVTALHKGDGATTVATNLAAVVARGQERTLLIDANLRRPALAERLATPGSTGLSDLLRGESDLRPLLQDGPLPMLHVLGAGTAPMDAVDLLGSPAFASLITKLRAVVDLIVIDAGALNVADPTLVAQQGDRTLLVARMGGLATTGPTLESDRRRVDALVGPRTRPTALALTLFTSPTASEKTRRRASSGSTPSNQAPGDSRPAPRDTIERASSESGSVAG